MPKGGIRKSFLKRFKITKKGKLLSRRPGQNHFRAKKSRSKQLSLKRPKLVSFSQKQISRYLN